MVLEARAVLDTDKIKRLADRLGGALKDGLRWMRIRELVCGGSLAHHGLLGSVKDMSLVDVNLSPVPSQHLTSLLTCVTRNLTIDNVSGCDLVSLLTSLKCQELFITRQSLGREETQALVQAMESGVEKVKLGDEEGQVKLDIEALTEYSGQGRCRTVELMNYTAARYRKELRTWARSRYWRVETSEAVHYIYDTFDINTDKYTHSETKESE